jgi:hypothetical protein
VAVAIKVLDQRFRSSPLPEKGMIRIVLIVSAIVLLMPVECTYNDVLKRVEESQRRLKKKQLMNIEMSIKEQNVVGSMSEHLFYFAILFLFVASPSIARCFVIYSSVNV